MNNGQTNIENLFNAINDFLFILNNEGNIIDVNSAVTEILGYAKEELKDKSVLLIHPEEYREKAKEIVLKMLSGVEESCPLPLLAKTGIHIPVETKVYKGRWNGEDVLYGISRNLSELALSEEKFYRAFESNQAMMALTEIESGKYININSQFLDTLGYTKSEIIGHDSGELEMFDDIDQRNSLIKKLEDKSEIHNEHVTILAKDGRKIQCLFSISLIKIQTYNYLLTSAIDITVLKQTEDKLKKNLKQQTILADISQNLLSLDNFRNKVSNTLEVLGKHTGVSRVYIFENNPEGTETSNTYEWCNSGIDAQIQELQGVPYEVIPSWRQILLEEGNVFSTNIQELPEDIVSILEPQGIKSILVLPLYVQSKFFGFMGFDECILEKEWEKDELELLRTVSGIISNSFERKIIQKQLVDSVMREKLALANTEAGLWDWNIETGEVIFNDIWCDMLGYSMDEVEPSINSWEKLVHPDDMPHIQKELNKHLEGKLDYYMSTHRLLTKSGEWKWIIDKGKVVDFDENNKPIRAVGTHIDIDHQKKREEELRKLNATKDKLFSIIAHDLRGPIGTIMQISEMVTEKGSLDEETTYSFLNSQKELSQSTYQLLVNLLNWARINSEQIEYNPEKLNLNDIVEETFITLNHSAKQKGIPILNNLSKTHYVFADEEMVRLIFRNLISNSIKFTDKGRISLEIESYEKQVEVKITDTGKGIPAENIEKILSPDQYFSTYGTRNEKGTGLGLKLCKNFIEQNNGTLKIESVINQGSTFSFTLPK